MATNFVVLTGSNGVVVMRGACVVAEVYGDDALQLADRFARVPELEERARALETALAEANLLAQCWQLRAVKLAEQVEGGR